MRFRLQGWLVLAGLLGILPVPLSASEIAVLEARSVPPFELLSPRAGDVLQAGSPVTLEWRALPALEAAFESGQINEWETFLSVDGGLSYPLRLTPHMESDASRLVFDMPDLPTRDARLLFRFGDGKHDFAWRLPLRFVIAASPFPLRAVAAERWRPEPGEPALEGEPGVTAWVEGSSSGEGLEWVFAEIDTVSPHQQARLTAAQVSGLAVLLPNLPALPAPRAWESSEERPERLAVAVKPLEILPPIDILAWTKRLNE